MEPADLHLKVAHYYYELHLSAAEIAAKLALPVTRVQRLLGEALENGLVEVKIPGFGESITALECRLEQKLALGEVVIADPPEHTDPLDSIAGAAIRTLKKVLRDGSIIGLSHGRAVATMVSRMLPCDLWKGLTVTRLVGALGNTTLTIPSDDIARLLADKLGADINLLFAPIILRNPHLRRALLDEPLLQEAFKVMSGTDIAVLGIGAVDFAANPMLRESLSEEDFERLSRSGAVGEICTHYYDATGRGVSGPLVRHAIAIEEKILKEIPTRIGVAGGEEKVDAILGACRGRYINLLVTDLMTARMLDQRIPDPIPQK